MGEAKRNREELLLYEVERRLAGRPLCSCPPDWFGRGWRIRGKMLTHEELLRFGQAHHRMCDRAQLVERDQG